MSHVPPAKQPDVVIVGGGIVGCALAYDLACMGVQVTLLDKREIATEASWASAGIISPPIPSMGQRVEMAQVAYARYPELVAEVESISGIETGYTMSGELMVADALALDDYRNLWRWQQDHDVEAEWLDGDALQEREPALHNDLVAGVFTPRSGSIRLGRFATALAAAAVKHGATVREGVRVTGIIQQGGRVTGVQTTDGVIESDCVVVAAGAWSGAILDSLDVTIPTHPVYGQMMAVSNPPVPVASVVAGLGGYIVPRADGSVAVGATEIPEMGYDNRSTPSGIKWLIDQVARLAPSVNDATFESTWTGLRPGSGDGELIVGRLPHIDNIWIAAGHYRSGALLAPATSIWLAASIVDGQTVEQLAPFDPARFL